MKVAAIVLAPCLSVTLLLSACASRQEPLPKVLPHYPCERIEHGRTVFHACSADEWVHQEITREKRT